MSRSSRPQCSAKSIACAVVLLVLPVQAETLPAFLKSLYGKNSAAVDSAHRQVYLQACRELDIDPAREQNRKAILPLLFYHRLLTGSEATNGVRGGMLRIPYFWHWTSPNPRHAMLLLPGKVKLTRVKPPAEFSKYSSHADIDRVPSLYLGDLLTARPQYYHSKAGSFYTFGWCSEREMAFNTLARILGYRCKIKLEGIHVWSEVLVETRDKIGRWVTAVARVDNTFGTVRWERLQLKPKTWRGDIGEGTTVRWYNDAAHSAEELDAVRSLEVSPGVAMRLENAVANWLSKHEP